MNLKNPRSARRTRHLTRTIQMRKKKRRRRSVLRKNRTSVKKSLNGTNPMSERKMKLMNWTATSPTISMIATRSKKKMRWNPRSARNSTARIARNWTATRTKRKMRWNLKNARRTSWSARSRTSAKKNLNGMSPRSERNAKTTNWNSKNWTKKAQFQRAVS